MMVLQQTEQKSKGMTSLARSEQQLAISVEDVSVRFGGLAANSNVTLHIQEGEILGLVGPNGAGKTTLVNCLSGFQRPSEGTIRLGTEITNNWTPQTARTKGIARTFQGGRLFSALSVVENVVVAGMAVGLSPSEANVKAKELLKWAGYDGDIERTAGSVPYVDERRIGIARALIGNPRFLLLDEPAAGMSDAEVEQLIELIPAIAARMGCGIVLIEHNMHLISSVCDRVHVLDSGKTLAVGHPATVLKDPAVMSAYLGAAA